MSRIIAKNGTCYVKVSDVRLDDALDLEGDRYADPETFANPDHEPQPGDTADGFRYQLAQVVDITKESEGVTVIETTEGTFGFPPDHEIEISLEATPEPMTRLEVSQALRAKGYVHAHGNRYAKTKETGRGVEWASVHGADDDWWFTFD